LRYCAWKLVQPFRLYPRQKAWKVLILINEHIISETATSHLFFLICIGFQFATKLALKLLWLFSMCCNFSSHPILHLSSHERVPVMTSIVKKFETNWNTRSKACVGQTYSLLIWFHNKWWGWVFGPFHYTTSFIVHTVIL
jgi:hypothetical protein